jgi:hypothetical protein
MTRAVVAALWRGERPRTETLTRAVRDMRTDLAIRRELRADRFRAARPIAGSDHPDAPWPAPPPPPEPQVAVAPAVPAEAAEEVPA